MITEGHARYNQLIRTAHLKAADQVDPGTEHVATELCCPVSGERDFWRAYDALPQVSTRVAFSAVREVSSQSTVVSRGQTIMINKAVTNIGGGFDTGSATFVCPVVCFTYHTYLLHTTKYSVKDIVEC